MISNYPSTNNRTLWLGGFLLSCLVLAGITLWVLVNNYISDSALMRWTKVLAVMDSEQMRLEYIGLMHPHIPIYLLAPFYYIKGMATPASAFLISVLCGGALLATWNVHLKVRKYDGFSRLLLILLVLLNPVFLWVVSSGSEKALSLLVYYVLCVAILRTTLQYEVRGIITLAAALGGYFFIDERAFFVVVVILPMIPFITHPRMLKESPSSAFILFLMPAVLSILSWFYLNWVFHGDAQSFLTAPDSSFLGASINSADSPWLFEYGGSLLSTTLVTAILAAVMFPVLVWQLYSVWQVSKLKRSLLVMAAIPVLAVALATANFFLDHPLEVLFLLLATTMAGFLMLPARRQKHRSMATLLLLLANVLVSGLFYWYPSPDLSHWRQSFTGQSTTQSHEEERRLGEWLARERLPTLIDERAAYRIIAGRGDSKGLIMSFMPEFKLALKYDQPYVEQIVVLNPKDRQAHLDHITQKYSDLYRNGMEGYRLVFQGEKWNVYRRQGSVL